jgi:ATP-dependent RNA helicase RhlE
MTSPDNTFYGLGIAPGILEILQKIGFTVPTPIHTQSIPVALEGKDLIGIAQTGTGKTLAFGIPLIQRVFEKKGFALVIVPTRELAAQVYESLGKVGAPLGLKAATLIGGESMTKQLRDLNRRPHVVIGTPGRLIDHLERKSLNISKTDVLVLDEADRMLDMGFAPQLKKILAELPANRQTMLFSATMPESIIKMANAFLKMPAKVEIAHSGKTADNITQELFFVQQEDKPRLLEKILQDYKGSVLVFARTKFGAKKIAIRVRALGHNSSEIHANRSLMQRREALAGFKSGLYRVLVATDIASRGIDVTNIELVINYDLPDAAEDYIHRIGRTGRAGGSGHAIAFARPNERHDVAAIERLMKLTLPVSKLPELPPAMPGEPVTAREFSRGSFGGGGRSFGGSRGSGGGHGGPRKFGPRPAGGGGFGGGSHGSSGARGAGPRKFGGRSSSTPGSGGFGSRPSGPGGRSSGGHSSGPHRPGGHGGGHSGGRPAFKGGYKRNGR